MSLGVDLLVPKTCSLDCVYCESGKTTRLTLDRMAYVDSESVIQELSDYLSTEPRLDYVTFSGWGEPLLSTGIPEIVRFIKSRFPRYKTALLTNGTLFYLKRSREDVREVDLIIASLDAVSGDVFKALNRPHHGLKPEDIIQGLVDLRKEYEHELWMEVFIVPGLNDTDSELEKLAYALGRIGADKVQINSLDRPGTESWVRPVEKSDLERIQKYFHSFEIIGREMCGTSDSSIHGMDVKENILMMIKRRPCTLEDILKSTGMPRQIVTGLLDNILKEGVVRIEKRSRGDFYMI
jgi:wyosine [tRNA(Phe)-imidazoG37] synthetase (radical SAM superfamily)